MKHKKINLRRCTGCFEMKNKSDLIRIVRDENNNILLDISNNIFGRGAYICKDTTCIDKSFKCNGLQRSFKRQLDKSIYYQIRELIK